MVDSYGHEGEGECCFVNHRMIGTPQCNPLRPNHGLLSNGKSVAHDLWVRHCHEVGLRCRQKPDI